MHSETDWGFSIGDDESGFSLRGYPTKQAAREAMDAYRLQLEG